MITPAQIEELAKLLVGDAPGWQARFVKLTGISRSHVSNLLNGSRSITQIALVKIVTAAQRETTALRTRADEVQAALSKFPTMGELRQLPRGDDNDA